MPGKSAALLRGRNCLVLALVGLTVGSLVLTTFVDLSSLKYGRKTNEFRSPPMARVYPSLSYDEQVGVTFGNNFGSLVFNVTAVAQSDPTTGVGPAYLLNGLTDAGFWYQVGLSYNWPDSSRSPLQGFRMSYEVFSPYYPYCSGSIFPTSCGGGIASITVNPGDSVQLSLGFSGNNIEMRAVDWNTGSANSETFSSEGASQFVGLGSPANSYGFFTGLMTEQYFSTPYYGAGQIVVYRKTGPAISSGTMWIDEFNTNTLQPVFSDQKPSSVDFTSTTLLQYFSSYGMAEASSGNVLVTGLTPIIVPSIIIPARVTGQQGRESPIALNVQNPSMLTIEITSLNITIGSGTYNTTAAAPLIIMGSSTFTPSIIIPSSLAVGNYTLRIAATYQFSYAQLADWISAQPLSANSTIRVTKSPPPQATTPPPTTPPITIPPLPGQTPASNLSTTLNLWLLAREILLPTLLANVAAGITVLVVMVHRRKNPATPYVAPLPTTCSSCSGVVTQSMIFCPKCGTLLLPRTLLGSSEIANESLGQPPN